MLIYVKLKVENYFLHNSTFCKTDLDPPPPFTLKVCYGIYEGVAPEWFLVRHGQNKRADVDVTHHGD